MSLSRLGLLLTPVLILGALAVSERPITARDLAPETVEPEITHRCAVQDLTRDEVLAVENRAGLRRARLNPDHLGQSKRERRTLAVVLE